MLTSKTIPTINCLICNDYSDSSFLSALAINDPAAAVLENYPPQGNVICTKDKEANVTGFAAISVISARHQSFLDWYA